MSEDILVQPQLDKSLNNDKSLDLAIIGAGPAGMSAALCAARADIKFVMFDKALPGGETATAYKVDNYLGFPEGILGVDLSQQMEDHIKNHKLNFVCDEVQDILNPNEKEKIIKTELGETYTVKHIIIATGLEPKTLDNEFEKKFLGRGISYYAQCDGESYKGKDVAVMGGGNCACYAADYLSEFVDKLYLIHSSESIKAVRSLKSRVLENPKISPVWNSQVEDVFGIDKLEKIKVTNITNDQSTWLDIKALFVYVGRIPPSNFLTLDLNLNEDGYIITDEYMRTNIPGIYAAGDIRAKQIRQIATAVSDGMIASVNVGKEMG